MTNANNEYSPDITVGAKYIAMSQLVESPEDNGVGLQIVWVKVNDMVLRGVTDVAFHADNGVHHVTLKMVCGKFATVDARLEP